MCSSNSYSIENVFFYVLTIITTQRLILKYYIKTIKNVFINSMLNTCFKVVDFKEWWSSACSGSFSVLQPTEECLAGVTCSSYGSSICWSVSIKCIINWQQSYLPISSCLPVLWKWNSVRWVLRRYGEIIFCFPCSASKLAGENAGPSDWWFFTDAARWQSEADNVCEST